MPERYPILRQMNPSGEQIPAIVKRDVDIVVTAGAGTGKTRTLVSRFLTLLSDGLPLRSIVAITFTIKAAREMRNRIREEIRLYLLEPELRSDERKFWGDIYENLDSARISTIHSFAADILRQHPAELGLDPEFVQIDEGLSARLKNQAVEAALAWAAEDDVAAILYPVYGDWKLRRTLRGLLNRRLELKEIVVNPSVVSWETWEPFLVAHLKSIVDDRDVIAGMSEFLEYENNGILQGAIESGDLLVENLQVVIESWKEILAAKNVGDWITISRLLGKLREHLKQKGRKANWAPADPRTIIKALQPIFDERLPGIDLDLKVDKKLAERIVPGLLAAFSYADTYYHEAKTAIQGLDFDDLEAFVLDLFNQDNNALKYWQEQIQALLIDEYQDTNARQRSLINLLNGSGGRLFIVGDGKQSIYRFRGADVAVFREEKDRITNEGSSFELSTSYRGHPDLVQNLNGMLEPVLGSESDLPWVETFTALESGRESLGTSSLAPFLEIHLVVGTKTDGAGRSAARGIASRILKLTDQENPDSESGHAYDFGDIAVLCRATSSFGDFEEAFEEFGIPYSTISGQGFYRRPEIRDLINTLRVFDNPGDDLAVAGLMRSPVFAVSDLDLFKIRDYQLRNQYGSMLDAVAQYNCPDEEMLQKKLDSFIRIVKKYARLVGRISVSSLLNDYLEETGYLSALFFMLEQRSVQNIRKLVADAEESGMVSVPEYLKVIEDINDAALREGEAQGVAEGAVQIMTVHQAKGMEFPVVILGDISKKNRQSREILINEKFGLLPPYTDTRVEKAPELRLINGSSLAYELSILGERAREDAESRRLFYVAATRAEDLLILSGPLGKLTKSKQIGNTGGWLGFLVKYLGLKDLELDCDLDGNQIKVQEINKPGFRATLHLYDGKVQHVVDPQTPKKYEMEYSADDFLRTWDNLTIDNKERISTVLSAREIHPIPRGLEGRTAPARIVGDVVHRALQIWKFPSQGEADFIDWSQAEFSRLGVVNPKVQKDGVQRAIDLLERFQDHDLFKRMGDADTLLHEVPYSITDSAGILESGVIDALFNERGKWYLVEFKTDQIRDQNRFDYIWNQKGYQDQVAAYLRAVERLLGKRPEGILCFLNYASRIHLVSGIWD